MRSAQVAATPAGIGAWEIAAGTRPHWMALLLDLGAMATGLVLSPRATFRAFVRGRRAGFMVAAPFEDLLALPLGEARERLGITPLEVGHPVVTSEAMLNPAEAL